MDPDEILKAVHHIAPAGSCHSPGCTRPATYTLINLVATPNTIEPQYYCLAHYQELMAALGEVFREEMREQEEDPDES